MKPLSVNETVIFNSEGLIPVIVQALNTKEVLMLAWMNLEALEKTLKTREMWYWSRSRNRLWRKGETSSQVQVLKSLTLDCDKDALLAIVEQTGVACHTGRRTCFFNEFKDNTLVVNQEPEIAPEELYKKP